MRSKVRLTQVEFYMQQYNAYLERQKKEQEDAAKSQACRAEADGDCYDEDFCPQLKDGEPKATGRSCPILLAEDPPRDDYL